MSLYCSIDGLLLKQHLISMITYIVYYSSSDSIYKSRDDFID